MFEKALQSKITISDALPFFHATAGIKHAQVIARTAGSGWFLISSQSAWNLVYRVVDIYWFKDNLYLCVSTENSTLIDRDFDSEALLRGGL